MRGFTANPGIRSLGNSDFQDENMQIRDADDYVTINVFDRYVSGSTIGLIKLSIDVSSCGFMGNGHASLTGADLSTFIAQLRELERTRQGAAELRTVFGDECLFRIWSVNRRGHLAVGGHVTSSPYRGELGRSRHGIEFGFDFDPTLLPNVLADFEALARIDS